MSALDLPLNLSHLLLLSASALGAGALNAIAGGGSFLTFPALVWTGLPPIVANATSAVAVSPGYLGSALGFRRELAELPAARRHAEALICALGGLAGAGLLLVTPARLFSAAVPWLLLFATVLFALGPRLVAARRARDASMSMPSPSSSSATSASPASSPASSTPWNNTNPRSTKPPPPSIASSKAPADPFAPHAGNRGSALNPRFSTLWKTFFHGVENFHRPPAVVS